MEKPDLNAIFDMYECLLKTWKKSRSSAFFADFYVRAVVGAEECKSILIDVQLSEVVENFTDSPRHLVNLVAIDTWRATATQRTPLYSHLHYSFVLPVWEYRHGTHK